MSGGAKRCQIFVSKLEMKKFLITFLLILLAFSACKKGDGSSSDLNLFSSDQTAEVIDIITDANNDLKQIKVIYKTNQNRVDELKAAMDAKDIEKLRSVAKELNDRINDGLVLGEQAVSKIKKAEDLNINDTYKQYLSLKRDALGKQLEGFELRRLSAKALTDTVVSNDPEVFKKAALILKVNEEKFQELIEEGKNLSQQANQIAKDAAKKGR